MAEEVTREQRDEAIEVADTSISFRAVLHKMGVQGLPEGSGKIYCPFGEVLHSDLGRERSMRVYNDSDAFCFSEKRAYYISQLWATHRDIGLYEAAVELLEAFQISYGATWEDVKNPRPLADPSQAALAEALRLRTGHDSIRATQSQRETFGLCLGMLGQVKTAEHATEWLEACAAAYTGLSLTVED